MQNETQGAFRLDPDMAQIVAAAPPTDVTTLAPALARAGVEAMPMPVRSVPLGRVEDLMIPGAAGPLRARLYAKDNTPRPLVVYWHGGGWVLCSLETHDGLCRALADASECAVLSVEYRLAPEHHFPAAADDARAALAWAVGNAARLGCRPGPLAVAGDSAGGNLAASVAIAAHEMGISPLVAHMLLFYPALDPQGQGESHKQFADAPILSEAAMHWFWGHYLGPNPAHKDDPRAAPLKAPDMKVFPPATIVLAECDPLRSDGEALGNALRAAGVAAETRVFEGVCHGFASMVGMVAKAGQAVEYGAARLRQAF